MIETLSKAGEFPSRIMAKLIPHSLARVVWRRVLLMSNRSIVKPTSQLRPLVTLNRYRVSSPLPTPSYVSTSNRNLWGYVNAVSNRPDNDRIREVGPQRACAEWLLRCGAHIRWEGFDQFQTDYNKLPSGNFQKFHIAEINADNAALMEIGFPHFDGVKTVRKIRFHFCTYLSDDAIKGLVRLKDCLEDLEISSCGDISDEGIASLTQLPNLKEVLLCDLPAVRYKEDALRNLRKALPACHIVFKDLEIQPKH